MLTPTATNAFPITPSDVTVINIDFLYVGGAGNLSLTTRNGTDVVINGVTAGSYIWIGASKVKSTGTTATNITGFTR